MRRLLLFATITISAALAAGCTATATPATLATGTIVNATLTDDMTMGNGGNTGMGYGGNTGMMGNAGRGLISVDRNSVAVGPVTFVVKNSGLLLHELVVLRTDVAHDKLGANTSEPGKVEETGNVGETGDVNAGDSKTFTVTLAAGHYVLLCNEVGHYAGGMHMAFAVN